jgi:UDP-GlcNAc:undecaprenyl-phosphate/decaprenyl-phosphate GlcNAc-1-phosphate transferase
VALGVSERTAVLSLYVLAAVGGALAVALRELPLGSVFGFVTLYLLLLCVAVFVLAAQGRDLPAVGDLAYRRRALELLVDLGVLIIAYYAAFRIRFSGPDAAVFFPPFVESIPLVVGGQIAALYWAGKYRLPWRAPVRHQIGLLGKALTLGMILVMMTVLTLYRFEGFSRGVFAIDLAIAWLLLVATRAATSGVQHYLRRQHAPSHSTLIYGAGGGGKLVLRELHQNRQLHLDPVGFIDDDAGKQRLRVEGIPVLGTSDDLEAVASRMGVADLIISVRQIDTAQLETIRNRCAELGIRVRRMRFNIDELRPTPTVVRRTGAD